MFRITRLLLIVVAAGLFAYSLHELQGRWLPMLAGTAFDISATMPDDSGAGGIMPAIFGCQAHPTWLKLIGWFAHLVVVGGLFRARCCHSFAAGAPRASDLRVDGGRVTNRFHHAASVELTGLNLAFIVRFGPARPRAGPGNRVGRVARDRSLTGRDARQGTIAYGEGVIEPEGCRGPSSTSGPVRTPTRNHGSRLPACGGATLNHCWSPAERTPPP